MALITFLASTDVDSRMSLTNHRVRENEIAGVSWWANNGRFNDGVDFLVVRLRGVSCVYFVPENEAKELFQIALVPPKITKELKRPGPVKTG